MKKIIVIFIMLLFMSTSVFPTLGLISHNLSHSYLYEIEWARTYGGDEFDMFHCVHQTQDEGFIISGVSEISNIYYPILMKLDAVGDEEWKWTVQQITYLYEIFDIIDVYSCDLQIFWRHVIKASRRRVI